MNDTLDGNLGLAIGIGYPVALTNRFLWPVSLSP